MKRDTSLIKTEVIHNRFGQGIIIRQDSNYIEVEFQDRVSKFAFPDAFIGFLTAVDPTLQAKITNEYLPNNGSFGSSEKENELLFSGAKSYLVRSDGLHILYSINSSKKLVRVHFFKLEDRKAKTACIQLPEKEWIECYNFNKTEIAEIRMITAIYANDIIKQALRSTENKSIKEKKDFIDDHKRKAKSFKMVSDEYLKIICDGLSGIRALADTNEYAYGSEEDVQRIFRKIENSVISAEDAFRINPMNSISFYNLRGERNPEDTKGHKKYVYCVELNHAFSSINKASLDTGINSGNIASTLRGMLKTAGGFHWEYRARKELTDEAFSDSWPKLIEGQESVVEKSVDYYMMLPYKINFSINDDGVLAFDIPDLPNCNGLIENVSFANLIIESEKRKSIEHALRDGIKIKELKDFVFKKDDFVFALQSSLLSVSMQKRIKKHIIAERIEEEDKNIFEAVLNAKMDNIGIISSISGVLANYYSEVFSYDGKYIAYVVFEIVSVE